VEVSSFRSYVYGEPGLLRVNCQEWPLLIKYRPKEEAACDDLFPLIRKQRE
jgi:hypothetical protein